MPGPGADSIVVVGGYGAVGQIVCTTLAERFPGKVFAAGRNVRKAEAFSRRAGGKVLPLKLDIGDVANAAKVIKGARVVVACAETGDPGFAQACLERSVHYVDVSASYAFLSEVESHDALAKQRGATAVLSVGLAPGLTNLLAKRCAQELDAVRSIDIFVLLGLGEAHGEAAVRWTLENLDTRFHAPGVPGGVENLTNPKSTRFPGGYGTRRAYRFDFADQHVISRTLGVRDVATRVCFDPEAATRVAVALKRAGAFRALRSRRVREALIRLLSRSRVGTDGFAVKVEAEGVAGALPRACACSISGREEGRATEIVASFVAERLHTSAYLRGAYHFEHLFDPSEVLGSLSTPRIRGRPRGLVSKGQTTFVKLGVGS